MVKWKLPVLRKDNVVPAAIFSAVVPSGRIVADDERAAIEARAARIGIRAAIIGECRRRGVRSNERGNASFFRLPLPSRWSANSELQPLLGAPSPSHGEKGGESLSGAPAPPSALQIIFGQPSGWGLRSMGLFGAQLMTLRGASLNP
jgi:hypothetical protein